MTAMSGAKRHVWITGASSGIGKAVALRLAHGNMTVSGSALDDAALDELQDAGEAGGIETAPLDVINSKMVHDTVSSLEHFHGPIDLAILNAGLWAFSKPDKFDGRAAAQLMQVNYLGVTNCLSAVLPGMIERNSGHIVITASVAGFRGLPRCAYYGPTKAALLSLAETLHAELTPLGIKVQVISPGYIDTPMTRNIELHKPFLMETGRAADLIIKGLRSRRFEIAFPWQLVTLLKVWRALPYDLFFWAVRRAISVNLMRSKPGAD
ncbi:MAG: SDR family NAD(P)-dependent oxidoreductase [Rhodobacteraceae bacterium]|nr:SDR family NAD(P)-dependent oxidoreductase [Paracoccaceae bacterium]